MVFGVMSYSFAGGDYTVVEKSEHFEGGAKHALVFTVHHSNTDQVLKFLKSKIKAWKGSVKAKNEIFVDNGKVKGMGENTFDAYIKVGGHESGDVHVAVAIDLGGAYLSSKDHPDKFRFMEGELIKLAKAASKDGLEATLKAQEKELKDMEKDHEKMVKDKEKMEAEIEELKGKVEENVAAQEESTKSQETKKAEIEATQKLMESL